MRAGLREAFGDHVEESPRGPTFLVPGGPHGIRVTVSPIGDDEAVVDVYTWVGRDVELTAEVARYLLEKNGHLRFAAAGLDRDGDLRLEASLFPDQVTAAALGRLVDVVAAAADELDQELPG